MRSRHLAHSLSPKGFTLPELLVTIAIIGMLASIGTVSYQSARQSSRDVKRVSDTKQIQTSIELYFENHGSYPYDGRPGPEGRILGTEESKVLSDRGFGPTESGTLYMYVPQNPEPGGSPYVYRSLWTDGSNCDAARCDSYAVLFTLEKAQGNLLAGPHAITPQGIAGAEGGTAGAGITQAGGKIIGIEGAQETLQRLADRTVEGIGGFVDDPTVETVAEAAIAPTVTVAAAANTAFAAHAGSSLFTYLLAFLTQPALFFGRKKRQAWGTAYNSLSKLPEDLVIIRLRDAASGRVVKSAVTDAHGRFSFLVQKGRYRIEAAKNKLRFPSQLLAGAKEDGKYLDLYHGEVIDVIENASVLTPNIPLDPAEETAADATVIRGESLRRFQRAFAAFGPVLGGASLVIKPSLLTGLLFLAQIVVYLLFRRLAASKHPKSWGIVYEERSTRPVPHAVVRIFAMPYHKLLETQVTDSHGRYSFRVGNNIYYLTVTKDGFLKTETDPVDLSAIPEPTVIASDLPIRKGEAERGRKEEGKKADVPPPAAAPPPENQPARPPVSPSSTPGDTA